MNKRPVSDRAAYLGNEETVVSKYLAARVFPFLEWFEGYGAAAARADAVAGVTVALVLIPQSIAYAQLAGLPPHYGLYASFLPPLVAALFGSSRQLATGPVAVVSLMTAAALEPLAASGSPGYVTYAIALSVMVGAFQFLLGLLRLGLMVNFISHPVILGFTNAAALIIASSQLPKLFGVSVDSAEHYYLTVIAVGREALYYAHLPTLLLGAGAFLLMVALRAAWPRGPNILIVVVLATLISWSTGYERKTTVDLSRLEPAQVRRLVGEYNTRAETLSALSRDRTAAYEKLARLGDEGLDWLNAKRNLDAATYLVNTTRLELREIRGRLRRFLFEGVRSDDGSVMFHLQGRRPNPDRSDHRTWRLKVGGGPLDPAGLVLTTGGEVVGRVPAGLPALKAPRLSLDLVERLLPYSVIMAILGFMEAVSIAKAMAAKTGHRLDPNRELIGQGLGNMIGAFGQSYPTSGSFSRSAVNLEARAVTGLSSVFTSLVVVLTLLFLTPLLYHLPQSVLAAVIMMAVIGLINVKGIIQAWRAQWYDGAIAGITFASTLVYAPHLDKGILGGVALSLMVFLYKSMRPKVVSLSRGEDKALHAALSHGLKECKYIDMIRFDGPLFFASAGYLEDEIIRHMETKPGLRHIIIEAGGINTMDASGQEALSHIIGRVRKAGLDISFSGVHQDILDVLTRTGMMKTIGADHLYTNMDRALSAVFHQTHQGGDEEKCPLKTVIYDPSLEEEDKPGGRGSKRHVWRTQHR
ncbi:MAG: SulP family inorganic anion transporter [Thermodesulfobacteriota bacterium]